MAQRGQGWIELSNVGPPVMAHLLPEEGDGPLGDPFPVLDRSTLALPAGDYRLRVHGTGRLGRTFRFAVNRGETQAHSLSLTESRLLGGTPIPAAPLMAAVQLKPSKADLIEWTAQTVIRRDGETGMPIWDASHPAIPWKNDEVQENRLRSWLETRQVPELLQPAPDLDGDGTNDLVWISRPWAEFLSLSGASGGVLHEHRFDLDDPALSPADDPRLPGPLPPGAGRPRLSVCPRLWMPIAMAHPTWFSR